MKQMRIGTHNLNKEPRLPFSIILFLKLAFEESNGLVMMSPIWSFQVSHVKNFQIIVCSEGP